ncbi:hypothetical protein MKW98_009844 [Papaver atlanticum]|uniref:DNA-binding protein RHL1 n=1 Tax=Papaver atlanticum TaxID=357466 RepID=A0AAD4XNK2_9MAGN|nr:hypothetical protein MKW98_009844 [Papaver atlanticum]
MVKATKKSSGKEPPNPEAAERKRLKNLGFSRNLLSQTPAKPYSTLNPSKTVVKHHGKDIIKKSQRKNRFLFSFPGLISPLTSGKIGELKDLGTKNPILYLDFPQEIILIIDKFSSQFGTIVYPKNRYLTLQFSKGGKNVMCEDYFDNMIVFSEAWWIGTKDENPEEVRLEFPKELKEEKHVDHDFKGGAGAGPVEISGGIKLREEKRKPQSPTDSLEDDIDISDDSCPSPGITLKDGMEVTHRQEHLREDSKDSPGDDSDGSGPTDVDLSEIKGKKVIEEAEDAKTLKGIPNLKNIQKRGSSTKQKQLQVEYESIEDSSSESEDIEERLAVSNGLIENLQGFVLKTTVVLILTFMGNIAEGVELELQLHVLALHIPCCGLSTNLNFLP